jgi:hypothetical protein
MAHASVALENAGYINHAIPLTSFVAETMAVARDIGSIKQ